MPLINCLSCQAEISTGARFCSTCGKSVLNEQDIKTPNEVSIGWLKSLLEKKYHTVEVSNNNPNGLFANSKGHPNIELQLKPGSNIVLYSTWTIKKPHWIKKTDFFATINKANSLNVLCSCYARDTLDAITVSSTMLITERLSSMDFLRYLDVFISGCYQLINESGLRNKFA